jgi:hypothetical protein
MRRLFLAARADPKLWAGPFRERRPGHEILEEIPADERPVPDVRTGRLPAGHAFWHHPRIPVSPHVAAPAHSGTVAAAMAETIRRHGAGQPVRPIIDRQRGS